MALFKGQGETPMNTNKEQENYHAFSTPFFQVGNGNLALPYVSSTVEVSNIVRFGADNLYPQLLNQMYYTSPLHGSIIDFKARSIVGGGYTIDEDNLNAIKKVNIKTFEKRNKLSRLLDIIAKDLIVHARVYFILTMDSKGNVEYFERVAPEKVRINKDKTRYAISEDWSRNYKIEYIKPYGRLCNDKRQLYCYELYSLGQDIYPLPQYSSALNWAFLDGEMSYLHKSNILNQIFPSFALMFPNKPTSNEERQKLKEQIEGMKGAANAGKVATFFAQGKDNMPEIQPIPVNANDNLFLQTDERVDGKICQAHGIDPLIFGIRVSGKLGSGTELKTAYITFEKNFVQPYRGYLEEIVKELMYLNNVEGIFTINEYKINEADVIEDGGNSNKVGEALNNMSPLLANKVLENLTVNEIRALASLKPVKGGDELPINEQLIPPAI